MANHSLKSQGAKIPFNSFAHFRRRHRRTAIVASVLLTKIAKHLALLACVLILGKAAGRFAMGELGIFLLALFATVAHLFARALSPCCHESPFKTSS